MNLQEQKEYCKTHSAPFCSQFETDTAQPVIEPTLTQNNQVTNLGTPVDLTDVENKLYVNNKKTTSPSDYLENSLSQIQDVLPNSKLAYNNSVNNLLNIGTREDLYNTNGINELQETVINDKLEVDTLSNEINQLNRLPTVLDEQARNNLQGLQATKINLDTTTYLDRRQAGLDSFYKQGNLSNSIAKLNADSYLLQLRQGSLDKMYQDTVNNAKTEYSIRKTELDNLEKQYGDFMTKKQKQEFELSKYTANYQQGVKIKTAKELSEYGKRLSTSGIPIERQNELLNTGNATAIENALLIDKKSRGEDTNNPVVDTLVLATETSAFDPTSADSQIETLSGYFKDKRGDLNILNGGFLGKTDDFRNKIDFLAKAMSLEEVRKARENGVTFGAMTEAEWNILQQVALQGIGWDSEKGYFTGSEAETKKTLNEMAKWALVSEIRSKSPNLLKGINTFNLTRDQALDIYNQGIKQVKKGNLDVVDKDIQQLQQNNTTSKSITNSNGVISRVQKDTISIDKVLDKLVSIESSGSYTAKNPKSSAYGKYQFLDSTFKDISEKTGKSVEYLKTPAGQEYAFRVFTNDNINQLKSKNIPITPFTIYGAHQQGVAGLSKILSGNIDARTKRNMSANMGGCKRTGDLRNDWINCWIKKTNIT